MTRKIDLIVFDPAGNTTLMVLTPVPRSEYAEVAKRLLEIDFGPQCSWRDVAFGEQVAYVVEGEKPIMEMCGLEFCGNASRSYAYYKVLFCGEGEDVGDGKKEISVNVSGCPHPLTAVVDQKACDSIIQMPLPVGVKMIDTVTAGVEGTFPLVSFEGISHLVLTGIEPEDDVFESLKSYIYGEIDPGMDAFGVMFIDEEKGLMSPIVYVRDVDTTYHEGSCASGTAAAAVAKATGEADGTYEYVFREPDGTLEAAVTKTEGAVTEVRLGGIIDMTEILHVEI
ncbi:MAG: hypothetical protein K6B42_08730 [Clostridia bacterium]|nr:hypothetical protein [Clostridia bacterium]